MPQSKKKSALEIVSILKKNGYQAFFVGGCVRDMALKRQPYDFDIASDAGTKNVKRIFGHVIPVGQ